MTSVIVLWGHKQERRIGSRTENFELHKQMLNGYSALPFVIPSRVSIQHLLVEFEVFCFASGPPLRFLSGYNQPLLLANRAASMRLAAPSLLIASDK
jgi:hypothetical protein